MVFGILWYKGGSNFGGKFCSFFYRSGIIGFIYKKDIY